MESSLRERLKVKVITVLEGDSLLAENRSGLSFISDVRDLEAEGNV